MRQLSDFIKYPPNQLAVKIALAAATVILYAGNQFVIYGSYFWWASDGSQGPDRTPGAQAAFAAMLAALLLLNTLLPNPKEGRLKDTLPPVNWLISLLGAWLAATVGYNWLNDATNDVWGYMGPAALNSAILLGVVTLTVGLFVVVMLIISKVKG